MFQISELWTVPIDVEFLADRFHQVYISQVRPMSPVHSRHWGMVSEELWEEVCSGNPPSNMVQPVGTVRGRVTDLRKRMISTVDLTEADGLKQVYVVLHESGGPGTSSMDLLEFAERHDLAGLAVIVDHGVSRRDDHMQYLMNEDPGVEFLVHTNGLIAVVDGAVCTVMSDGFRWQIG